MKAELGAAWVVSVSGVLTARPAAVCGGPVILPDSWAVRSMLELEVPGIEHRRQRHDGSGCTIWMAHPDRSWARASADGPRRLWDTLEDIRDRLNTAGELPVYGSKVTRILARHDTVQRELSPLLERERQPEQSLVDRVRPTDLPLWVRSRRSR